METAVDHDTAMTTRAAERYALGEMTDAEAAAFEAHFFDCRHCAQDVRDAVSFSEGARAVFREDPAAAGVARGAAPGVHRERSRSRRSRFLMALPAAAALFFLGVALYQAMVVVPGLRQYARPAAVVPTVLRVVRAAPPVVTIREGQALFQLVLDVNAPGHADRYRLEFRSSSGKAVASLETRATDTGTLHVLLPAGDFPPGEYTMKLEAVPGEGEARETLEEYRFRVERTGKPRKGIE